MKYLLTLLFLTSCSVALREAVEDHAVITNSIADRCRAKVGGYPESPCSEELLEDLDAAARQADCIDALHKREKCPAK